MDDISVPAVPATTVETLEDFTLVVETASAYEPGVLLMVSLRNGDTLTNTRSRAFAGIHLNLTPDDADELAAALVAHAWDRRRHDDKEA